MFLFVQFYVFLFYVEICVVIIIITIYSCLQNVFFIFGCEVYSIVDYYELFCNLEYCLLVLGLEVVIYVFRGLCSIWILVLDVVVRYKVQFGRGFLQQGFQVVVVFVFCGYSILCLGLVRGCKLRERQRIRIEIRVQRRVLGFLGDEGIGREQRCFGWVWVDVGGGWVGKFVVWWVWRYLGVLFIRFRIFGLIGYCVEYLFCWVSFLEAG